MSRNLGIKVLGAAVVMSALGAATPALADECKLVNFDVKNNKTVTIRALKMEYKFSSDLVWRTEAFSNTDVPAGQTRRVASSQNLAGGEGNKLLGLKLRFQAFCGGKWSKEFVSQEDNAFDDTSPCGRGRSYRMDLPASDICGQIQP